MEEWNAGKETGTVKVLNVSSAWKLSATVVTMLHSMQLKGVLGTEASQRPRSASSYLLRLLLTNHEALRSFQPPHSQLQISEPLSTCIGRISCSPPHLMIDLPSN